ncbi:MAG: electron transfer flavoprotein subunit beta/FixA family protein [Elusimicrobia bacterium]|nr:electron transfer flavoprotein subunit beta/FixA family protein [Elusimicrobiota bacterium]
MNIAVLLRQVPDTEAKVVPDPDLRGRIMESEIKFILNPYDEYAVEEAVRIIERGGLAPGGQVPGGAGGLPLSGGGGEAVGFCIGPDRAETALRSALALGLARAVLVSDPAAVEADVVTQGRILAAAIKGFAPSLILAGRELIDTQEDALAAVVAHFLDIPHVLGAGKITLDGEKAVVLREVEGGSLEIAASLPAAVSCSKGLNEPRYPSLMAIKRSKAKEIRKVSLAELGVQSGPQKSRIAELKAPPPRAAGVRVEGEPAVVAAKGIEWMADVAKVI